MVEPNLGTQTVDLGGIGGTSTESGTYGFESEELRRVVGAVQRNPNCVVVVLEVDTFHSELLDGLVEAFPSLEDRVFLVTLGPHTAKYREPFMGSEWTITPTCNTMAQVEEIIHRRVGQGIIVEVLHSVYVPPSVHGLDPSIMAEDIKAVMEKRGGYRFFKEERIEWSTRTHSLMPERIRANIKTLLLARLRGGCILQDIPMEMMFQIFFHIWLQCST